MAAPAASPLAWLQGARHALAFGALDSSIFAKPDRSVPEPEVSDEAASSTNPAMIEVLPASIDMNVENLPTHAQEELQNSGEMEDVEEASCVGPDPSPSASQGGLSHEALQELHDIVEEAEGDMRDPSPSPSPEAVTPPPSPSPEVEQDPVDVPEDYQLPSAMRSNAVVLDAPWRIVVDESVPVPQNWSTVSQAASQPHACTAWQCSVMKRLGIDESTPVGQVWSRLKSKVEDIAGKYVAESFNRRILPELRAGMQSRGLGCNGDVRTFLAMAGADVADHEATMRQAEELVRAELPQACVASVSPENFRSSATVMRNICEQLMSGGSRLTAAPKDAAAEVEAEEGEWPEDLDVPRQLQKAGLNDCLDWYLERQAHGGVGGVVLLVERVEAVPKDLLRDALSALGNAFCSEGIPFFVVLGLQHAPQDCVDLFEGKPLAKMRLLGAERLFDARIISTEIIEWLLEDTESVVVLPPNILDWLRRGRFEYTRKSVSLIMKALALLCVQFFAESPFGALCAPFEGVGEYHLSKEALEAAWTHIFQTRLQKTPELMEHLEKLWASWWSERTQEEKGRQPLQAEVAQAAARATCWRQRLIASLGVWDVLCAAVHPMTRHDARLRRLCKLFEELWPKDSEYDVASLAEASGQEQEKAGKLLKTSIKRLGQDANLLNDKEVLQLLDTLIEASTHLDGALKKEISALKSKALEGPALRGKIQDWLQHLQSLYWIPLDGSARIVFREVFCAKCADKSDRLHLKVEGYMAGGKPGNIVETPLLTLASSSEAEGKPIGDAAFLYRLLECSTSRSVEVSDLWKNFLDGMTASSDSQSTLKQRFGHGLLALHAMGLISPQAGGKSETGSNFDHWRLRKRHFGRVWLKGSESLNFDDISALCAAAPEASAADVQLALRGEHVESLEQKPIPAWAQRFLPASLRGDEDKLPSFLKRKAPLRPTGFDPTAKKAKGVDKSRPRIFMG